jgi:hypothetical protein
MRGRYREGLGDAWAAPRSPSRGALSFGTTFAAGASGACRAAQAGCSRGPNSAARASASSLARVWFQIHPTAVRSAWPIQDSPPVRPLPLSLVIAITGSVCPIQARSSDATFDTQRAVQAWASALGCSGTGAVDCATDGARASQGADRSRMSGPPHQRSGVAEGSTVAERLVARHRYFFGAADGRFLN